MLERQEDFRDKCLKLDWTYNIAQSLNLHQVDHKANTVQEFSLIKIVSHRSLGKSPVGYFKERGKINQYKADTIIFLDMNAPTQRVRNQVEIDVQIAHRLQEEWAKEPYQSFQTTKHTDTNCINHQALVPHGQNRQNPSLGQARSNRSSNIFGINVKEKTYSQ